MGYEEVILLRLEGDLVKTFKRHERAVAAILGGRRVGNSGRNTEDVAHDG